MIYLNFTIHNVLLWGCHDTGGHSTQSTGQFGGGMSRKAYLEIIFPLANILGETREDERRDTAAG